MKRQKHFIQNYLSILDILILQWWLLSYLK
jgi:hypothetical protein